MARTVFGQDKEAKITFSFHLSDYLVFNKAVENRSLKTPNVDIKVEEKYEHTESTIIGASSLEKKSIVHISMQRSLDSVMNTPVEISAEAFHILISFLQVFRMRTRNFRVNPSRMYASRSQHEGIGVIYNPREIEGIKVICETDDGIKYPLQEIYGNPIIVASRTISGMGMRPCSKAQWQEICQEFEAISLNGPSFSEYELLANELLAEAYGFIATEFPTPLTADPLHKFEFPNPRVCAAVVSIAMACEIYIKGYIRENDKRGIYQKIFERHRDFTMPVWDYLDFVVEDIDGISLKTACLYLWQNIKLLFQLRNRIVHSGEVVYRPNKRKYRIDQHDIKMLGICVEDLIDWLRSTDKRNFSFREDPKLKEKITSRGPV